MLYDNNLFIVEAKAGSLSSSTRRGSLERTRRDLSDLIDSAYSQALRTKRFIAENDRPVFEHEDGSEALVIEDKRRLDNTVLVNVTLESLQHLSTQLSSLSAFDLIREQEWPWSVFINDLRVMSEIVESPSEFLVYLKRRIRANDFPQFRAVDELDFLTYFFNEGLYFEDNYLKNTDIMQVTGYTDDLDLYYEYMAGRVAEAEKPRFKIPDDYRELVARIESTGKEGRTKVSTALLECDSPTFEYILNGFRQLKSMIAQDGRDHDFTVLFKEPFRRGITFMVTGSVTQQFLEKAEGYCNLKKYQTRSKEWVLITVETDGREDNYDCRVYDGEWQHDTNLEQAVEMHKKRAVERHLQHNGKIGRNDPCPCNSGLKYKKCCGSN